MQTPWRWSNSNVAFHPQRMVCYDSEFVRENTYFPKLALVQWQSCGEQTAVLCDPLTMNPPWQALQEATLIVHSGRQDLELIRQESGTLPRSVRDTQIGFALCYPEMSVGFAEIVRHYLGIEADKSATRSNWLQRPLTRAQLNYAANDVGLLSRLYPLLCAELNELGRLAWWAEECRYLLERQRQAKSAQAWYKLRHAALLKGRETAVAALLHGVREMIARDRNCPRKEILDDQVIVNIAQSGIKHIDELGEYLDYDHLLFSYQEALDEGFAQIERPYPTFPRCPRLNAAQQGRLKQLSIRTKTVAQQLHICPDMLGTQKNLRHFVAGIPSDCRIDRGWRRPFFADLVN